MKTIDRLKQFIDYKGISLTKFDTIIDAGTGYIGKTIKRNGSIGSDMIEKIVLEFPELNPMWLITGSGEMLKQTKIGAETPDRSLQFTTQKSTLSAHTPDRTPARSGNMVAKSAPASAPPTTVLMPQIISVNNDKDENILYVPVRAAAGYLNGSGDPQYMEQLPAFNLPGLKNKTYRAFQVDGESMVPTLENKEMVVGEWIENLDYIREDYVHVIVTKNRGVIVKRVLNRINERGYIIAKSDALDNRNLYPNIEIYPDEIAEIWLAVAHINFKFRHPTDTYKRINNMEADLTEIMRVLKQSNIM